MAPPRGLSDARLMARRTREIWQNLIGQFERSGLTQEEFAAKWRIPVGTMQSWIYRFRRERQENDTAILPVRVVSSRSPSASQRSDDGAAVEVLLLRFAGSATSDFIADVVTRLRRC
jgi:hypothetical protein